MRRSVIYIIACVFWVGYACDTSEDPSEVEEIPEEAKKVLATAKVMTYNIHHANPPSKPDVIDIDAIVSVIRGENPDLVALQEVDVNTERSGPFNQAEEIARQLGMYHFFGKAIDYQGGDYGVAILSRYRLSAATVHRLPNEAGSSAEARIMVAATIKLPDSTAIRFASTHLDAQSNQRNRLLQIEEIVEIAAAEPLPFIIGGDLNATPDSEEISVLDNYFERSCRLCPPTIPALNPTRAIDYIAYVHPQKKLMVASHKVANDQYASDHRPVIAIIDLVE